MRLDPRTARLSGGSLWAILLVSFAGLLGLPVESQSPVSFANGELLGRPTDGSVTVNLMADKDLDVYFEYGVLPGVYSGRTGTIRYEGGRPIEAVLAPLQPDTRYYYRTRYRLPGESEFLAREEHAFRTRRPAGSAFVFDVEADPHLDANSSPELFRRTLANIRDDNPDFLIDLGDTFFSEKQPVKSWETVVARHLLLRTFFDPACSSVPLYLALGNHEGEWGTELNGTPENLAVWATKARKLYYPNPVPDEFYAGDTVEETFVGLRQNYYAWEWGDALFVVIDPYWYTTVKPSTDNWTMTLGETQYRWLRNVLENSAAKLKFVFGHQLVGGYGKDGRGGAAYAGYYEWGGNNSDGSWGFATRRPGWAEPIHALMVRTGVSAFFHGHDHFFAKESLDGIVYQLVPQPSHAGNSDPDPEAYGYADGVFLGGSGHLRISVGPTGALVEYIRAVLPGDETSGFRNGDTAYSYFVFPLKKKGGIRR